MCFPPLAGLTQWPETAVMLMESIPAKACFVSALDPESLTE